jgi:hypothetical protein
MPSPHNIFPPPSTSLPDQEVPDPTYFPTSKYSRDTEGNLFLEEYEYVPIS